MITTTESTHKIAPWKIDEVNNLKKLLKEGAVISLVDMMEVPAVQLQEIRDNIRDLMTLRMSRNTLIKRAIEEVAKETNNEKLAELANYLEGGAAIVITDMSPFKLYKTLEEGKAPAPIKAGAIAPNDIVVEAGSTGMPPGPFLGELKSVGLPAVIDKGKIAIKDNTVIVKEGEVVSQKVAVVLSALGIKPTKVGLNLLAVYEDGIIYTPDLLVIDEDKYFNDIQSAFTSAFNLSVNAAIPTADTIETILQKAFTEGKSLSVESAFLTEETTEDIIGKANAQMLSIASELSDDALDDELKDMLSNVPTITSNENNTDDDNKEEEKEEEKEEDKSEEAAVAGLGMLF